MEKFTLGTLGDSRYNIPHIDSDSVNTNSIVSIKISDSCDRRCFILSLTDQSTVSQCTGLLSPILPQLLIFICYLSFDSSSLKILRGRGRQIVSGQRQGRQKYCIFLEIHVFASPSSLSPTSLS